MKGLENLTKLQEIDLVGNPSLPTQFQKKVVGHNAVQEFLSTIPTYYENPQPENEVVEVQVDSTAATEKTTVDADSEIRKGPPTGPDGVYVVSCKGVRSADLNGKSDPYFKYQMNATSEVFKNCEFVTGPVVKKTLDPFWNVLCKIPTHGNMEIQVWDKDTHTSDDFLGLIKLETSPTTPLGEMTLDLQSDAKHTKKKAKGTIKLNFVRTDWEETYSPDPLAVEYEAYKNKFAEQ